MEISSGQVSVMMQHSAGAICLWGVFTRRPRLLIIYNNMINKPFLCALTHVA